MKLPTYINKQLSSIDTQFLLEKRSGFRVPSYRPTKHYKDLVDSKYYWGLLAFRHCIKLISEYYFSTVVKATNVDLFMVTPSISSPMGPGSNSEAIRIRFGDLDTNLVDSSQFGLEPLLLNKFNKLYCYLPSLRGEKHDRRHLNQFFHCESEIKGTLDELIPIIEGYIKALAECSLRMSSLMGKISLDPTQTKIAAGNILKTKAFKQITFDDAVLMLKSNGYFHLVYETDSGRDIKPEGEIALANILKATTPFWIRNYDRDRVPFYQKPDPQNSNRVINADLLFPPLIKGSFGGEILGAGQRQDSVKEMRESLIRQGVSFGAYKWYIDLRRVSGYKTTSGFGMGIERFITWLICRDDIRLSIPYPRLKNVRSYP